MNDKEIFEKIKECLTGALGIEPETIQPKSSHVRDLGAESIDFIDIIFRLEKTFDMKIPSGELFPTNLLNQEHLLQAGRVTSQGLALLRERIPYLDLTEFEKNPQVSNLADHFTVQMLVDFVKDRLSKDCSKS